MRPAGRGRWFSGEVFRQLKMDRCDSLDALGQLSTSILSSPTVTNFDSMPLQWDALLVGIENMFMAQRG